MARKKENPNQLKMFMTAREIMDEYEPIGGDYIGGETTEELWERKADEAEANGLLDSIKKFGVQVPVSLDHEGKEVMGGHHRIAAQHRLNPDQFIPINYETNPRTANFYDMDVQSRSAVELPHFTDADYEYEPY